MDPTANRRRRVAISAASDANADLYPHDVIFYKKPPADTIDLNDFEDLAVNRLRLLRVIEETGLRRLNLQEWKAVIKQELVKVGLKTYIRLLNGANGTTDLDYQARRFDHISHFIMRLAYCRSEVLRRWFLNREMDWFKLKLSSQSSQGLKTFFAIHNLNYTPISAEEKDQIKDYLLMSTPSLSMASFGTTEFFKVSFTDVPSLVDGRKVYINNGIAYVPISDMYVCVQSLFRSRLNRSLNNYFHEVPKLNDERITHFIANLNSLHTGLTYTAPTTKDAIDPANLDVYSKKHYPLCMKHMHEVLRSTHHLKHDCRLQYGLFLKGIGLLYEDAMKFWRSEFTKHPGIDDNKFDKGYAYGVKHLYGQVGNRVNYSAYSCIKLITGSVAAGEHHGCPFKHWEPNHIKRELTERGITGQHCADIEDLMKHGHFQVACSKYFECTHGKPPTTGISHPNQYFDESVNLEKEKNKKPN